MRDKEQFPVEFIEYNSRKYELACQLRYEFFFAEHNLPWEVVRDIRQADYFHAAIVVRDSLLAYGQLVPHSNGIYQICQMVVQPDYQGRNLGRKILSTLIEKAREQEAIAITLNARLTAIGFYQKLGFQTHGHSFPSTTTGVPHIGMKMKLHSQLK